MRYEIHVNVFVNVWYRRALLALKIDTKSENSASIKGTMSLSSQRRLLVPDTVMTKEFVPDPVQPVRRIQS